MSSQPQHIAVIRLSAMGDVAMTVPVLLALTQQYPNVRVTMISRPLYRPFFDDIANVSFVEFDPKVHKGLTGILRFVSMLRKHKIDAFADLHNVLRSKIIRTALKVAGVKVAAFDKARAEKKALTRTDNKIFEPLPTVFERHVKVFASLGFQIDTGAPTFLAQRTAEEKVRLIFEDNRPVIGIAPFAQHDSKVYPFDLMQQVIANLATDYKILLFGSRSELAALEQLASNSPNVEIVAAKYTFEQELQIISHLSLMLSMDSGNAHIAAMYGVTVVTLWGATHPFTGFAPYWQPIENALVSDRKKYPKLPTSIYGNKKVEGYDDAMRTISPEMVVAKVREVLR